MSGPRPGPDAVSYPTRTQAAAADRFIARHRGEVGLITVSIAGNDLLGCTAAATFIPCVTQALPGIEANLNTLLTGLRQAAGPGVPIVGLTYPDVYLGLYTSRDPAQKSLADVSVAEFIEDSVRRRFMGHRAGDDVFGRVYTLDHPHVAPLTKVAAILDENITCHITSLLTPTTRTIIGGRPTRSSPEPTT